MKHLRLVQTWIAAAVLATTGMALAQTVDAVNPEHQRSIQVEPDVSLSPWLPVRIRQLEAERRQLLENIEQLPQHEPITLADRLGYHSVPRGNGERLEDAVDQIEVEFEFDPQLGAIALVPAFIPNGQGSYAFPRRFRIEILDRGAGWVGGDDGEWVVPPPPYEWVEVVNWLEEDFPGPGHYPVFFSIGGRRLHQLRMTMPHDEAGSNMTYHALGEIYLFRQQENGSLGDNMMAWGATAPIRTTGSLSKPPVWDEAYLKDGVTGLGLPLSEDSGEFEDFMVFWGDEKEMSDPVQIILDLGNVQPVGRVQLWPAEAPYAMEIPQFGFPGEVSVELSDHPGFKEAKMFAVNNVRRRLHRDNLLNVITGALNARYIRITLGDLGQYKGKTLLGLGEIRVSEFDETGSLNCRVTATGIPRAGLEQLPRLVDGYSRRHRILREVEWIRGLAQRRPLDRRLAVVEQELELARADWGGFKFRAIIWGGGLICIALLGAMGLQRLQRRKVLKKLKARITRDLHDEVGSNLGGITLAARRMEDVGATPSDLGELSLMAREASASLRDVVWVIDQTRILLPELLKKLGERAERVLSGLELEIELPVECPNREVPLPFKRHLLMFFKEAVHNCARHSNATKVQIGIAVNNDILTLYLKDNGCGFDPDEIRDGWGVDSMRKRAEELGGKMDLQTAPGRGTTIKLTVPLSALLKKTDHSYKTSN